MALLSPTLWPLSAASVVRMVLLPASLTLLIKVHSLIGMQTRGGTPSDNPGQDDEAFALGQQVSKAEREAAAIIERLQKGKK